MAEIRLDGVSRTFGQIIALIDLSSTIADGETVAVLGPSGSGKSTLLRVLAGLDPEYTGEVYYDRQNVREIPPGDRYIGMVFQNYALYPHFRGHGNLNFFFRMHKAPDAEADERIRATASMMGFGFEQLLGRKPGTLSGGEQQRLAIARALVRVPRLFLFDEPLSNLDAKLRVQTRVEIKRLLRQFGITAVYVTHDQEEAIALGDRLAILREGRLEQIGPFSELRERPANLFVAGFLGRPPMSLIPGVVVEGGLLRVGESTVPLRPQLRETSAIGRALTLGVHPEDAWVGHRGQPGPEGVRVSGQVEVIEPDFARHKQTVYVRSGDASLPVIGELDRSLRLGETAEIVLPDERLYFFDTVTGARM